MTNVGLAAGFVRVIVLVTELGGLALLELRLRLAGENVGTVYEVTTRLKLPEAPVPVFGVAVNDPA